MLDPAACSRAVTSRDPRFDGVFFVGITTTRIYCRPVCPARVSYPERRRFFDSAAAAERNGFRPCLRCRPELAPGRALCDAVPRLARAAALRIAEGGLNGREVAALALELGVGERQLRRAMERELGVSPVELAQTHRLLLAKCLLTDTALPVTRVAFSSGFQSLRRFNTLFQERYRMSPTAVRRGAGTGRTAPLVSPAAELVRLTLSYRAPLAWDALVARLARESAPGIEAVRKGRYGRTVSLEGCRGVVFVGPGPAGAPGRPRRPASDTYVTVDVSASLLPVLMPVLARLRRRFDLDAEPAVIDAHLAESGLQALVRRRPGLRVPAAFDGFESAARELIGTHATALERVVAAAAEPLETGYPGLTHLPLTPARLVALGASQLVALGVAAPRAESLVAVARMAACGELRLEPGSGVAETLRTLVERAGVAPPTATAIVMQALHWPDAFTAGDRSLELAAGASSERELLRRAEQWRPWRAYAAAHLRLRYSAPARRAQRTSALPTTTATMPPSTHPGRTSPPVT